MPYETRLDGADTPIEIFGRRPDLTVRIGEIRHAVAEETAAPGKFAILVDGVPVRGWRYAVGDAVHVRFGGRTFVVGLPRLAARAGADAASADEIRADMPGTVVALHAAAGQPVAAGERLVTIESMKLQTILVSPRDGVVAAVHGAPESSFERGALLVSLEPEAKGKR